MYTLNGDSPHCGACVSITVLQEIDNIPQRNEKISLLEPTRHVSLPCFDRRCPVHPKSIVSKCSWWNIPQLDLLTLFSLT